MSNFVVNRLPNSIDKEVGMEVRKQILSRANIDAEKTALLDSFYKALNYNDKTKVYIVNGNEFNAFALPDNSIFVYKKVLKDVKSYQELAALLGHEYTHIKLRHGMKSMAQALSRELLASILTRGDNQQSFIRNSNLILTLKNSREFETQADLGGLQLLRDHNIDQNGMTNLFKTMINIPQKKSHEVPEYLSTHPDTEERLEKVEETIKANPTDNKMDSTLQRIFEKLKVSNIN